MKILYKTMWLCLLAVCLCTLAATPVSAKVCFVGEENCTGGGSFDNYKDPAEDGEVCKKEGYSTTATECRKDPNKDITAYCPYNNNYVKCCGKEYVYDAPCVYPLVTKGKCGNKYKCECDSTQYKFTDNECKTTKGSAGEGYENSYGSGSFCTQQSYDSNTQEIVSEVKYSSCQCDRGIYPKFGSSVPNDPNRESDCDNNAEKQGPCSTKYATGNKTETYYKFCRCNTKDYPKTDSGCYPLTGDASQDTCFDTIMHYRECASCGKYPARNLDHVPYSPGSKAVQCERDQSGKLVDPDCDYEVCPYDQSGNTYFNIRKCNEPGYKAKSDGSGCEPKSCKEAVMDFLKTPAGSGYALFDGSKLIDGNGKNVTSNRTAIIAADMSLSSGSCTSESIKKRRCSACICKSFSSSSPLCLLYDEGVCDSRRCYNGTYKCCTSAYDVITGSKKEHGGLGCVKATSYYAAPYLMETLSETSDGVKALKVACTKTPTVTYTSSVFPYIGDESSAPSLYMYGINLKFNTDTTIKRAINIYNADVNLGGRTVFFQGNTQFLRESSRANNENTRITNGNIKASIGSYYSNQYSYDVSALYFWNIPIKIKMNGNQEFKADTLCTLSYNTDFMGGKYFVKHAYIGANCHDGWIRGAKLRVRDGAKWYMYLMANNQTYSYKVQMRDGALFCVDPASQILFNSGQSIKQGYSGGFDGCRIYHDKDRTLSNGDWDPSDYTSWKHRGGCGLW